MAHPFPQNQLSEDQEEWKTIDEFPNYEVSNMGRVRNKRNHLRIMPNYNSNTNSYSFKFYEDAKRIGSLSTPKTVALAFIPNPNNYRYVINIDGDKTNNKIDNLKWVRIGNINKTNHYDELKNFRVECTTIVEPKLTTKLSEPTLEIKTIAPIPYINWIWHNARASLPIRETKVLCYNSNDKTVFIGWLDEADWMGWTTLNELTGQYEQCHVDFWAYIVLPTGETYK